MSVANITFLMYYYIVFYARTKQTPIPHHFTFTLALKLLLSLLSFRIYTPCYITCLYAGNALTQYKCHMYQECFYGRSVWQIAIHHKISNLKISNMISHMQHTTNGSK